MAKETLKPQANKENRPRGFRAWNVAATKESGAWTPNRLWLAEAGNAKLIDDQIAPGFTPDQKYDLANFGGKTVSDLTVQVFYVSSNTKTWTASDSANIDNAFSKAFADWRLNTVMSQYFQQPITTAFRASAALANNLDTYQQTDVENLVKAQYNNGTFAGDFPNTLFCLLLAPGIRLYDSNGDDSYNGLGGYHGTVDITRANGTGTDRVYYAVGVYSQKISNTTTNGINVFSDSWKNVVATFYHEINEMRTDADVEDATSNTSNILGWYSTNYGEIGDIPILEAGTNLSEVILDATLAEGSGTVPIQLMYSNMDHGPSFGLNNGDLVREANGAIWVIFGGARFHVPDPATLNRLYPGKSVINVATGGVNGFSTVPVDGTLLREESSTQVYIVQGGSKVPTQPPYPGTVQLLWTGALAQIP